ncbi:MAG: AmmeMemoRadiSam system protein B [Parabacteroides sp.]
MNIKIVAANIFNIIFIMSISTIFSSGTCSGQDNKKQESTVRPEAVAGTFYPAGRDSLVKAMNIYFKAYAGGTSSGEVAAVIVPHAGYVFSGEVAASAFAQISPKQQYERIFLIGPSHHVYMDGASVNSGFDYYATPLGNVPVDTALCRQLIRNHSVFSCNPAAHDKEHCLEVQLPFLQYRLKKMAPIIPIIVATQSSAVIQKVAEALKPYFNAKNLFVISSDFSHYPSYDDAVKVDKLTGESIGSGSLEAFVKALSQNAAKHVPNLATSACGESAIATLLYITAGMNDIQIRHIMYRNSGDSSYGDHQQVVGYHAFAFMRKSADSGEISFSLTEQEKDTLIRIVRSTIQNRLSHSNRPVCDPNKLTEALRMRCGAFVTLNEGGRLRGCIGHFGSDRPLYRVVEDMAEAAAFEDPRFYPMQLDEFEKTEIEISVLSPMKRIRSIEEFTLGKQGIYITKGGHSGTFLPQVAEETNWSKEEFLGHCAHDKAGLSWDGWKDADLYTYEAVVFKEKE